MYSPGHVLCCHPSSPQVDAVPSLAEYSRGTATEKTVQTLLFSATLPAWIQVCGVHPHPSVKKYGWTSLLGSLCLMPCLCMAHLSVFVSLCSTGVPPCVACGIGGIVVPPCVWPVCAPQGLAAKYMKKAVKVDLVEKQGMQASTDVAHYMLLVRTGGRGSSI